MILQPQSDIGMVRHFLRKNGFYVTHEKMCKEDEKFYNSLRAVPCRTVEAEDVFSCGNPMDNANENMFAVYDEFGELLLKSKDPILKELLSILKYKNERNLASIEDSENERGQNKKIELQREKECIERALLFYN